MNRILLLLALAACDEAPPGDLPPGCPPVGWIVDEDGPAPSGHRELTTTSAPAWAEPRELPLHVWYPTAADDGEPVSYLGVFDDPDSLGDAPFEDRRGADCPSPLVVWSHGDQGWAGNGTDLLRRFVEMGWIAAAPDHTDNTLVDDVQPRPVGFDLTRAADVSATIDALAALPDDDPLAGRIDTDRVLVIGHSYGGQTAWLMSGPTFDPAAIDAQCAASELPCTDTERAAFDTPYVDPRVLAVAPLDGSAGTDLVAAEGWASRDLPVLYMSQDSADAASMYERAAGDDVTWVRIQGACHESFTSTELPCDLPKDEGLALVAEWLLAFGVAQVEDPKRFERLASEQVSPSDLDLIEP